MLCVSLRKRRDLALKQITLRIPEELLKDFDEAIKKIEDTSRSRVLRSCIRDIIKKSKEK